MADGRADPDLYFWWCIASRMVPRNVGRLRLLVTVELVFLAVTALGAVVDAGLALASSVLLAPFAGTPQGLHVVRAVGLGPRCSSRMQ